MTNDGEVLGRSNVFQIPVIQPELSEDSSVYIMKIKLDNLRMIIKELEKGIDLLEKEKSFGELEEWEKCILQKWNKGRNLTETQRLLLNFFGFLRRQNFIRNDDLFKQMNKEELFEDLKRILKGVRRSEQDLKTSLNQKQKGEGGDLGEMRGGILEEVANACLGKRLKVSFYPPIDVKQGGFEYLFIGFSGEEREKLKKKGATLSNKLKIDVRFDSSSWKKLFQEEEEEKFLKILKKVASNFKGILIEEAGFLPEEANDFVDGVCKIIFSEVFK